MKLFSIHTKESPFRPGSDYDKLMRLSRNLGPIPPHEFVRVAARKLHKSQQRIKFDVYVLATPGHSSNCNRTKADDSMLRVGKLQLVSV
jgi:hypothetical protein